MTTRLVLPLWLLLVTLVCALPGQAPPPITDMVQIEGGKFVPFYGVAAPSRKASGTPSPAATPAKKSGPPVVVGTFYLDRYPVTNRQYLAFVRDHPQWRRSRIKRVFAEGRYLTNWRGDLEFDPAIADSPVTWVSWFAARAYAKSVGKRLPSQYEWEYAARASETSVDGLQEPKFKARILGWYGHPTPDKLPHVKSTFRNVYGLYDMHGLVWEWVEDFNSVLLTGESRGDGGLDRNLFCAAGVSSTTDPGDYAAYMRHSFRYSLQAKYVVANLGFRCASSTPSSKEVKSP